MPNVVEIVKKAALEAVEASKPVAYLFGTVVSISPLTVQVDQKLILTEGMLILSRNVTDFTIGISQESGDLQDGVSSPQTWIKVHNALQEGEKVLLTRIQKRNQFVILDRIGGSTT